LQVSDLLLQNKSFCNFDFVPQLITVLYFNRFLHKIWYFDHTRKLYGYWDLKKIKIKDNTIGNRSPLMTKAISKFSFGRYLRCGACLVVFIRTFGRFCCEVVTVD